MMEDLSQAIVVVEATLLSDAEFNRTQSICDLFAWCGGGTVTPRELHAYLKPDASKARPRAAALLLRSSSGRHYLATASHALSNPVARPARQESMEPDNAESDTTTGASDFVADAVFGMIEIAFDESALPHTFRKGLFPAASFPHLDLSLVRLDEFNFEVCAKLEAAGFVFVDWDRVEDAPSADDIEVQVIGKAGLIDCSHRSDIASTVKGHVKGLNSALSFFWIDAEAPPALGGAPVTEGEKIVGFFSPQQLGAAHDASASFATITKAGSLRPLLAAHEAIG